MLIQLQKVNGHILFSFLQEAWPLPIAVNPQTLPVEQLVDYHDALVDIAEGIESFLRKERKEEFDEYCMDASMQSIMLDTRLDDPNYVKADPNAKNLTRPSQSN